MHRECEMSTPFRQTTGSLVMFRTQVPFRPGSPFEPLISSQARAKVQLVVKLVLLGTKSHCPLTSNRVVPTARFVAKLKGSSGSKLGNYIVMAYIAMASGSKLGIFDGGATPEEVLAGPRILLYYFKLWPI